MKHNQHGFSALWLGFVVLVIALAGIVGWRVYEVRSSKTSSNWAQATLTGVVKEGPTSPICKEGESCDSVVSNHTIEALDTSGNIAATGKTDENGRYILRLQPGHYSLTLVPQIGLGHVADEQVDIIAGTTIHDLVVDTGIR